MFLVFVCKHANTALRHPLGMVTGLRQGLESSDDSAVCLPGSGWFVLSEEKRTLKVEGKELPFVQAVYQNGDQKELFLYFFLFHIRLFHFLDQTLL